VSIDESQSAEPLTADSGRPASAPDVDPTRTEIGASPVFSHVWPDSDELNARIRQLVEERMATTPGLTRSNCGGWQSERDLQRWDDPAVDVLLERVRAMVRSVVAQTVDDPDDELLDGWEIRAWANVNRLDDRVAPHDHAGGLNIWAAIYYVDCKESSTAVTSGITRFIDTSGIPRPIRNGAQTATGSGSAPGRNGDRRYRCADPERDWEHDLQVVPTPGKMVMFPANLPHYVTPYLGTEKRITIAFNLCHTKFLVSDFESLSSRHRMLWRDYRGLMLMRRAARAKIRDALASVVPVEKWPAPLHRRLVNTDYLG
jgi:hypothetical protein